MRAAMVGALLLLPLAAGGASGQAADDSGYAGGPVEVTLFGHVYDLLDAVPMTTQPMDAQAPDLARGYSEPTVAPVYGAGFNRIHLFNSMGPVEYNASLAQPRIHPERGLALDLLLDPGGEVKVVWYMSADALELRQLNFEPPVHGGAVPHLMVRAEVRLGNDVRKDLGDGNLVAAGEATVDLVSAPGPQPQVIEIPISLGSPLVDVIPARESFNLGVEWFQVDASGTQVLMPGWNLHTGPLYPNRLVLPVRNPLYLYFVEPQFAEGGRIVVNAAFNSPLGNYDVDHASLAMDLVGPGGFRARTVSQPVFIQHSYQHNEHNVATINSWVWDHKQDQAPPGNYTVTVKGCNLQGTACAEKAAIFTIEAEGRSGTALDSEGQEVLTDAQVQDRAPARRTPAFEAPVLALALGLAMALGAARRR